MIEGTRVKFREWDCIVQCHTYSTNDRLAISLVDANTGEPVAFATKNLEESIPKDCVMIKDYSENKGMVESLTNAGILEDTGIRIKTGYVELNVCRIVKQD